MTSKGSGTIEVAALGRPFSLGMLYDCRNDSLVPAAVRVDMDEDCTLSEWEAVLELDEALAGWLLQGPDRGEWGWEWGWAASDHQDPEWDTEDVPAVSPDPYA
ncbi:hypothetical protein F7725_021261 [Dissostichus mawsoni]|uniref:Uncharacterized protein n=1 Tax=Dissostichus mawsoni TaxID=36200 RepID=A0A7J5YGG4_DISMA|nr:hypothetical protein F7725_021261 [Dissostichus mawsoni]